MTRRGDLDPRLGMQFAVSAARDAGVPRSRLRASDLQAPFNGARSTTPITGVVGLCRAYLPVAPARFAFSHVIAARLYGIALPSRLEGERALDVSVPLGSTPPRRRGVTAHRATELDIREFEGLPLLAPCVVWLQLARSLDVDELVVAGDSLVRRKGRLTDLATLHAAVDAAANARGVRRSRAALADIRPGTDSAQESRLRLEIVRAGLPEPVIGHTVFHEGAFVGTPDLAYRPQRIAIEYQGSTHWRDEAAVAADIARREMFIRAGWRVLEVTASRLRSSGRIAGELAALLAETPPRR
ncbi:MAG: hypothetical protein WA006_05100 [Rhodoglobus sp.]